MVYIEGKAKYLILTCKAVGTTASFIRIWRQNFVIKSTSVIVSMDIVASWVLWPFCIVFCIVFVLSQETFRVK